MRTKPAYQEFAATAARRRRGLSLIELMIAVALLAIIILGLVAMFNQTRKAFTLGLTAADYQDSGRVVMDMVPRELEQLAPTGVAYAANFYVDTPTNLTPYAWPLLFNNDLVTNSLQRLYFVTRYNQQWNVSGYFVNTDLGGPGVGTLYRWSANNAGPGYLNAALSDFTNYNFYPLNQPTVAFSVSRVIDGVVDFRIRAYAPAGATNWPSGYPIIGTNVFGTNFTISAGYDRNLSGDFDYLFLSNAVPGYVELELAVLEPRTLERWRSLTNSPANALDFLTNHAGQVHVFRQRIPIRSVAPGIYP